MTREKPIPAAAVALVRDTGGGIEVYLNKRPAHFRYYPGAFVFPGGRVDEADGDIRITACREVREEIGVEINSDGLSLLRDILTNPKAGPVYHMKTFAYEIIGEMPTTLNREEVDGEIWIGAKEVLNLRETIFTPYQVSAAIYTISRFDNVSDLFAALKNGHINDQYLPHRDYWL
jgi:8-oxo-dGTP pyrophosphatase MutT (NUDIX family)